MATTDYQSLLKDVLGSPVDLLPTEGSLAADIGFAEADRSGDRFEFPVHLQDEQGFTYNTDHEAFTLEDEVSGVEQTAFLDGSEIAGVAQIATGLMTKMSRSRGSSKQAYDQAMGRKIENLMKSAENRREISMLYGPGTTALADLGVVGTVVSQASTTLVVFLTRASYSPGLWKQLIGAKFDFYTSGGTQHTANAAAQLTSINTTNHRLTFTKSASDTSFAASDVITFRNSRAKSAVGLQAIADNTGTLFNIAGATFPQWRVEQYAVGGPLTFDKVIEGATQAADNGCDYGLNLYLNLRAFSDLMTDEAALRRHPDANPQKKQKVGYQELEFNGPCGRIMIKPHRYMKQGIALALPVEQCKRVGSTDLTFRAPGSKNEWFFRELDTKMGCQIRCYSDQAIIIEKPFHAVQFTGVASTADIVPA